MANSAGPTVSSTSPNGTSTTPMSPLDLEEEPQSAATDVKQMWIKFAKTFIVIFPIYVLGYFEFSFSWVLIGLALFFWWKRNHGNKNYRFNRALAFLEHEEKVVRKSLPTSELPPWVHFPDVERVEWLNKTVKQMWPYICQFVDKLFRETIEPAVKCANSHLNSFCFTKIDMGDKPIRVNGVKVYTENVDKRQIIMDLEISFVGNTEIDVDIKKYFCKAGIKSIQLYGTLRVVMEPLLGDMPLIGALSVFFLKKPLLDINWTGLTNVLDIPGIKKKTLTLSGEGAPLKRSSVVVLDEHQQQILQELLDQYLDIFAARNEDCTQTNLVQHDINTGPIHLRPHHMAFAKRRAAEQMI
ncbi:extended synaptotagmin-2-A [Aplochiton taeniatus]